MTVRASSHGRQYYYVCSSYDHRGRTVCPNGLRLPMPAADDAILARITDYVLSPEIVEGAVAGALEELRPSRDSMETRRSATRAALQKLEGEQAKYVQAIAVAGDVDALARAVKDLEERRQRLNDELAGLDGASRLEKFDARQLERVMRRRLDDCRGMLRRQIPLARQVLSCLLDGRIGWTPRRQERLYEFAGRVRFDGILSGFVLTQGVVPVRGFEPRSRG